MAWSDLAILDSTLYTTKLTIGTTEITNFVSDPVIHRYGVSESLIGGALGAVLEFEIETPIVDFSRAAQVTVTVTMDSEAAEIISDNDGNGIQGDDDAVLVSKKPASDDATVLTLGTFYINTREPDVARKTTKYTCVDAMRKADIPYWDNQGTYPMTMADAVRFIAAQMGVTASNPTSVRSGSIDYPAGIFTMREVLQSIAAYSGGNFVISRSGELQFLSLASPASMATYECMAQSLVLNGNVITVQGVMLFPDNNTYVSYGSTTTGLVSADCIYATTDSDAQGVLQLIRNRKYYPYHADIAPLDPKVDTGITVKVSGEKFVIWNFDMILGKKIYFNIDNPADAMELEQEFAYSNPATRSIDRQIAKSYSEITKTTDQIESRVVAIETALGKTVELSASAYAFVDDSGTYSPSSITIFDSVEKSGGTYAWYIYNDTVTPAEWQVLQGQTASSLSITPTTFIQGSSSALFKCEYTQGGTIWSDQISIPILVEGADGESAFTIVLTNQFMQFPIYFDANGNQVSSERTSNSTEVWLYKGTTKLAQKSVYQSLSDGEYKVEFTDSTSQGGYNKEIWIGGGMIENAVIAPKDQIIAASSTRIDLTITVMDGGVARTLTSYIYALTNVNTLVATHESRITQNEDQIQLNVTAIGNADSAISSLSSELELTDGKISAIVNQVGSDGTVTAASIVASINATSRESNVVIDADHISLDGVVDFINDGSTTIDGDKITTGTISADRLDSDLVNVNGKIKADAIEAHTIVADSIASGSVSIGDGGTLSSYGTGTSRVNIDSNYGLSLTAGNGEVYLYGGSGITLDSNWRGVYVVGNILPSSSGNGYVGTNYFPWAGGVSGGWATTSDKKIKKNIEDLDERYSALFDLLKPVRYKYKKGTSDRYHTGMIAQDVEQSMSDAGLTDKEFAAMTKERNPETGNYDYALRYEEFIALCIDQIQRLKTKTQALEEQVANLTARLDALERGD